jgi:tRNA-2-methylthio-N6-dimethylallyladenosine synthase
MARHRNICHYIHLPAQSGNDRILDLMNRNYPREWYMDKVRMIREILPDCGISCDIISGFCSETEEEHQDTLSLMDFVKYDFSYMFYYSERPGTLAAKKYADDIPLEIKKRRLAEIIDKQAELSTARNLLDVGQEQVILIDGASKKSTEELRGRNSANKVVIVTSEGLKVGDYVRVKITESSRGTLFGTILEINPSSLA